MVAREPASPDAPEPARPVESVAQGPGGVTRTYDEARILDVVTLAAKAVLDTSELQPVTVLAERAAETFVLTFQKRLATQPLHTEVVRYPATWLDALKARFLPERYHRLARVRYRSVRVDVRAFYPKLTLPEGQDHVVVSVAPAEDAHDQHHQ